MEVVSRSAHRMSLCPKRLAGHFVAGSPPVESASLHRSLSRAHNQRRPGDTPEGGRWHWDARAESGASLFDRANWAAYKLASCVSGVRARASEQRRAHEPSGGAPGSADCAPAPPGQSGRCARCVRLDSTAALCGQQGTATSSAARPTFHDKSSRALHITCQPQPNQISSPHLSGVVGQTKLVTVELALVS